MITKDSNFKSFLDKIVAVNFQQFLNKVKVKLEFLEISNFIKLIKFIMIKPAYSIAQTSKLNKS